MDVSSDWRRRGVKWHEGIRWTCGENLDGVCKAILGV